MSDHKEKLGRWINITATLATTILAVVSLLSVYITLSSWQEDRESSRPYFTFKDSPYINVAKAVNLNFKFNNVGNHPALNFWSKTLVFAQNLKDRPIHEDQYALVNDIPKDTVAELALNLNLSAVSSDQKQPRSFYIVIALQYDDPILHKHFSQVMFLKWNGVSRGRAFPLIYIEADEKENILHYLQQQKINLYSRIEPKLPLESLD